MCPLSFGQLDNKYPKSRKRERKKKREREANKIQREGGNESKQIIKRKRERENY